MSKCISCNISDKILLIAFCFLLLFFPRKSEAKSIFIAAIFATSGIAKKDNFSSLQGIQLAVREINARGGIFSQPIKLGVFDNKSSAIGSKIAAEKAVKEGALAIIGAAWSSHSIAIAKVAQAHKIPMLTNNSTYPAITLQGDFIFRICFNDIFQGKILATFANEYLHATTAGLMIDLMSDYSTGLAKEFQRTFQKLGGKIVTTEYYLQKDQHFQQQLQSIKNSAVDILFIPGHDESGLIAKNAMEENITSILLGGDGWGVPSFLKRGGQQLKIAYYSDHWSENLKNAKSQDFVRRFRNYFGKESNLTSESALAYDSMMLLANAIWKAGDTDRKNVRDALAKTKNFVGVTGNISFDKKGDPLKTALIMRIKNGHIGYLKTVSFQ